MKSDDQEPDVVQSETPSVEPKAGRWSMAWHVLGHGLTRARDATLLALKSSGRWLRNVWFHLRLVALRARAIERAQSTLVMLQKSLPRLGLIARNGFALGALVALTALSILGLGRFGLRTIDPGTIGVRYSKWDGDGVSMRDFGPGLHLSLPGVHRWYELPAGTGLLSWKAQEGEGAASVLDVRTLDGTSVQLSLTIPYSILDGHAHQLVAQGLRTSFRDQARARAEQVLLNELGALHSEEFSLTEVRRDVLERALLRLNQFLAAIHLEAEAILVDAVAFSPAYEKKLVETQRERQRGRVLVARQLEDTEEQIILRRRSEIDQELLARRMELDREIEDMRAAGQIQAVSKAREVTQFESDLRADADRGYASLLAQGETTLADAFGLERQLHGEILGGSGGEEYLALQAARSARLEGVLLDSNDPRMPNPLDVERMLELFGLKGGKAASPE
ncbi:MAG: hypothetical protein ACI9F9_003319 [Candidatus Paceibacteria bacterium]|jgi:hypothetical protein